MWTEDDEAQLLAAEEAEARGQNGWLDQIANSQTLQAVRGFGDRASNELEAARVTAVSPIYEALGYAAPGYEPIKTGEGLSYDLGAVSEEIAPYLLPSTWAARLALGAGRGLSTNPQDPIGGGLKETAYGVLGEAVGPAAQALGKIGGYGLGKINLDPWTKELAKKIPQSYEKAKSEIWEMVGPTFEKYGETLLPKKGPRGTQRGPGGFKEFNEIFENDPKLISPDSRLFKSEVFDQNPTLQNAYDLTRQLGKDIRKLGQTELAGEKKHAMEKAQKNLEKSMLARFEGLQPGYTDIHKAYKKRWSQEVVPYESNEVIKSSARGNVEDARALSQALSEGRKIPTKGSKKPPIPEEHMLADIEKSLKDSVAYSDLYPEFARKVLAPGSMRSRELVAENAKALGGKVNPLLRAWIYSQGPSAAE